MNSEYSGLQVKLTLQTISQSTIHLPLHCRRVRPIYTYIKGKSLKPVYKNMIQSYLGQTDWLKRVNVNNSNSNKIINKPVISTSQTNNIHITDQSINSICLNTILLKLTHKLKLSTNNRMTGR